ncbi:MAG: hypothetical protein OHK93_008801 [Ramalina farinacea]|uniref:F-box domain-containing protein n=1 Tax=Ramalina farinacea TaxID=258253 RepID=A0AA43QN39_9LECA|nr:hypothetical protein [Ramalina farinacea]
MSRMAVGLLRNGRNAVESAPPSSCASLDGMPIEIKRMIFDYLAPCDEYTAIRDLCQLRLANKSFAETLAPRVFRTFTLDGCQKFLKERIDWQSHTHNDSELRLIRYLGTYAHFMKAQKMLLTDDTAVKVMARSFRRLPNIQAVDIFTGTSNVGAAKLTRSFEALSARELDNSGMNTLKSLFQALNKAPVTVRRLAFITDTMLCTNEYNGSHCDLIYSSVAKMRRKKVDFGLGEEAACWTDNSPIHALPSSLARWLTSSLLSSLRDFRLYLDSRNLWTWRLEKQFGKGIDGDLYLRLNRFFRNAGNLERLEFGLNCDCYDRDSDISGFNERAPTSTFDIGAALKDAYPTRLKHVELRNCQPERLDHVLQLFRGCTDVLEVVYIEECFDAEYDALCEILRRLKKHQLPRLKRFDLFDDVFRESYVAGPYLQGLEANDPLTEAAEKAVRR